MIKRLNDTIYGFAYRDLRYKDDEWNVHFVEKEEYRDIEVQHFKALMPASEIITFEFSLEQVVGD